jgi:hypothetical protein
MARAAAVLLVAAAALVASAQAKDIIIGGAKGWTNSACARARTAACALREPCLTCARLEACESIRTRALARRVCTILSRFHRFFLSHAWCASLTSRPRVAPQLPSTRPSTSTPATCSVRLLLTKKCIATWRALSAL